MEKSHQQAREMFLRLKDFARNHPEIPAETIWPGCVTQINTVISDLDGHVAAEAVHDGAKLQDTELRSAAHDALRELMLATVRTARAIALDHPGFNARFRMPQNEGDEDLINAASGMATAAGEPDTLALFVSHGMPADLADEFHEHIAALQTKITDQSGSLGERKSAGALIETSVEKGMKARRKMDAFARNFYRDNPAVLAEWDTASHIARGPRRRSGAEEPPKNEPGK